MQFAALGDPSRKEWQDSVVRALGGWLGERWGTDRCQFIDILWMGCDRDCAVIVKTVFRIAEVLDTQAGPVRAR
ncbi:hypothetical protein HOK021_62890 [Streptomyces hygroscopicus]|nr:hypothetical protein HOK021_62890 [Streptomyces hygroscopicus]